jgi:hypothetical protein
MFSTAVRRGIRSSLNSRAAPLASRNASTSAGPGVPPNVLRSWYNM